MPCIFSRPRLGIEKSRQSVQHRSVLALDPRLHPRRHYLLGISGGRDSVALLHALLEEGYRKITLCHLNHQLRGLFSSDDAAFVRSLAEKHELPFEIARDNVQRRARESGVSIELAAREARHEFFALCARKHRCNRVLLAHHADDNAETALFNLCRGSSGLKGMSYESSLTVDRKKLVLLRPLLGVRRSDIDDFLEARRISYRDDASNADPFAVRNRLRHEVLPLLNEIMGRDVTPAIVRATEASQDDRECLDALVELLDLVDPQERLFLPKLRNLPESVQRRALFLYLLDSGIPDLSSNLITRCLTLLDPEAPAKVNLPGDQFLRRRSSRIFVE